MARYFGELTTDVYGSNAEEMQLGRIRLTAAQAAAAAADAVHAAITGSASVVTTVTTAITNPSYPRALIITPGGTTADVAACDITVTGTNIKDEVITEAFAFLANASTATTGVKAFKTVTSISIPIQDGAAATFTVGTVDKLGLPYYLTEKPLCFVMIGGTRETTDPTLTYDADEIEKNTCDPNTALNGTALDIYVAL